MHVSFRIPAHFQHHKKKIVRTNNQRHFYESQRSWLSKFCNNNRNSVREQWRSQYFSAVAAIYTVLRVLSGKITRATTEQLVVSIEHQPKWNRDQHEVHFTKPIFRPQVYAWWQEFFKQLETLHPSRSQLLLPAPTPPPALCKLNCGSNLLSRCCMWTVNSFSTSFFVQYGRTRSNFRDTRARISG